MGKAFRKPRSDEPPLARASRIARETAVAELANAPPVNPFAAAHGDYERNMRHVLNRGGTAVDRWRRDGLLSETQQASILHCQRLWRLSEVEVRVVANLDRTVFGCPGNGNVAEIDARKALKAIERGFLGKLREYWDVFENVCRFDEPAGTAGSRLANDSRTATMAARLIVCFVADVIYERERLSY